MLDFLGGQHGRGLIEHQHAVAIAQIAGNLHHLLHAYAQLPHGREGIDMLQAHLGQLRMGSFGQGIAIQPAPTLGQAIEQQVFGHSQGGHHAQLLQHHAHAKRFGLGTGFGRERPTIELHDAARGSHQTAQHFGQRGFAGAVLPRQRQTFAGAQIEGNAIQHGAWTIVLAHALQRQHRRAAPPLVVVGSNHLVTSTTSVFTSAGIWA